MSSRLVLGIALFLLLGISTSGYKIQLAKSDPATITVPDDYLSIQEAINNAVDGDAIFVKAGIYYEHVVVNKTVALMGEEASTTIVDGNNTGHVISIIRDNVSITGFTVQRSGNTHWPALEAGICLNHSADCVVSGNHLVDNGFCGVSLLYSQRNAIIDNNVTRSGWGGIHLLSSSHNIVSRNVIDNTYGAINGHASSHYNNITENVITNSTYGMFYHNANHNNICRNNVSTIAVEGIELQDRVSYNNVAENKLTNCSVGIKLLGPNYNNIVSGNIITDGRSGIWIMNARYTEISNNIITHNYGAEWDAGIRLDSAGHSMIHSNRIADNWRGILLYTNSPHVTIYNNNITDNDFAVRVASGGSNYLNVSDNIVMNNRNYGIGVTGFGSASNYATVSRNLIVNNSDGIALGQYSNYNLIFQNNISQNSYGFYIDYSTQNTIWENNIADNAQQVYVSTGSVNYWDRGYITGGNYWSDHICIGNPSSGSQPYIINTDNTDYYPFQDPNGWFFHQLTVTSSPMVGIPFTIDGTLQTTAYTEWLVEDYYTLQMPENHGEYVWSHWLEDSDNSRVKVFVMNTNVKLTGVFYHLCDLDKSGNVDMQDIAIVARAYGSYPSHPNWNPNADINQDGRVDLKDVALVAKDFGK